MTTYSDSPRLYVGTYAKYNAGSIEGAWLDLDDYADRDDFLAACAELHKDEPDPELMFQDFENFPRDWYSESSAPPAELWDWIELSDDDKELLAIYLEHVNQDGDIEQAREEFRGKGSSRADCVEDMLTESGQLSELPGWAQSYIDFDSIARDWRCNGTVFVNHEGECWMFEPR